jgi:release factor glutamine methyltransferase
MNNLIKQFEARLTAAGSGNAKRAVEELVAHVMGCKPLEIYFKTITPEQRAELEKLIVRAEQGEPIQYIIGYVDFRGLEIRCDRRALIPRPETEQLVEQVLHAVQESGIRSQRAEKVEAASCRWAQRQDAASTLKIADVGTGTGCIALSLLHELPNAEVIAIDISPDALALARENAKRLGLSDRFHCLESDLLGAFMVDEASSLVAQRQDAASTLMEQFDIVVSNPPYILSDVCKMLDTSVRDFEPKLALDGGADGLDLIRTLIKQAARVLKPGGGLFIEIGYDQGLAVSELLEKHGFQRVAVKKDLAGLDRIVVGVRL